MSRASFSGADDGDDAQSTKKFAASMEPNNKSVKLQTDMEMWMMDEMPVLFGVDDSDELDESLQEDGQANMIENLVKMPPSMQAKTLKGWLGAAPDEAARDEFIKTVCEKVQKVQAAMKK